MRFLFLSLFALWLTACGDGCPSTKEQFLQEYYAFIDETKQQPPTNDADWQVRDDRLHQFIKVCYPQFKGELAASEQLQFWWSGLTYFYARYGKQVVDMVTNDALLQEVKNQLGALGKDFNSTVESISNGWNSFQNGVQNWWQELKGLF